MGGIETQNELIALLQRAGNPADYAARATIFEAGAPAASMYVVVSGTVAIEHDGQVIEEVGPSGLFGEMALIDAHPRSATAIAQTDVRLVSIEARRFWFLVQETPYFAQLVMRVMAQRLRRADTA